MNTRLSAISKQAADEIKGFGNTSDVFSKEKLLLRVLRVREWESKLIRFVGAFAKYRLQFEEVFALHVAPSEHIRETKDVFDTVDGRSASNLLFWSCG